MLQQIFERVVGADRFHMPTLHKEVWLLIESQQAFAQNLAALKFTLGDVNYNKLGQAILRNVFLIELVKLPKVESTKFRVRWSNLLTNDSNYDIENQQRFCSFEECLEIAADVLNQLANGWLATPENRETLELFFSNGLIPFEAPIDYFQPVARTDNKTRMHRLGNIGFVAEQTMLQTLRLRKLLRDKSASPDAAFFQKVLGKKIKVKTYLTDRVLTGNYKTNREKRWETHPHSEHFATRRDCLQIEHRLLTQLVQFAGFPSDARSFIRKQAAVELGDEDVLCPVTLEPLNYVAFRDALIHAKHGRSDFQVGHLNPLKLGEPGSATGHTAENISWISADGNRIQGSYSLVRTRAMVYQIEKRYEAAGLVPAIEASIQQRKDQFAQEEILVEKEETAVAEEKGSYTTSDASDE